MPADDGSRPADPFAHRGRGARLNPVNRYTQLEVELDLEEVTEGDLRLRTRYLDDTSRSAVASNSSPDIGFDFSVNPYRGCEHGCSYCLDGATPVLMADGASKRLADVVAGDRVLGTVAAGGVRRLVETEVLDRWTTRKPAYKVALVGGTELVASAEHLFLTEHGWRRVASCDHEDVPALSPGDVLVGWGAYGEAATHDDDYALGYLSGVVRGDGLLGHQGHERPAGQGGGRYRFELVLEDERALGRAQGYLERFGVRPKRVELVAADGARTATHALRSQKRADYESVALLTEAPPVRSEAWRRGFLAGLFDTGGAVAEGELVLRGLGDRLLDEAEDCLDALGFATVRAGASGGDRLGAGLRLAGGAAAALRLVTAIDPAARRRVRFAGAEVTALPTLRVAAVERLDDGRELHDLTTGTGDFVANGVVAHNCYARPTHEFLGLSAGLDFERVILVKRDAARLVEERLRSRSWRPTVLAMSGVTDPYQPVERKLGITRAVLRVLARYRNPVGIITKNALVTRDLDVLSEMASWGGVSVFLSVTTLDETLRARLEPRTSTAANRLRAVRELAAAGVPVGVNVAPIIPGLTDHEVPDILAAAAEAGAAYAGYTILRLPGAVADLFADWLEANYPLRKEKVLNRVRASHDGRLSDPVFFRRMRGHGAMAEQVRELFHLVATRLGLERERYPELNTSAFRLPGSAEQPSLF